MSLPGFTAAASLYKVKGQYRMSGIPSQGKVSIQPAIRLDFRCFRSCLDNCQADPDFCSAVCNNRCGGILVPLPFPT